jgi:hypothetical protein
MFPSQNFKYVEHGKQKKLVFKSNPLERFGPAAFFGIWLTIWSIGCIAMLVSMITDFSWFMLLFSVPFFAAWVAGAAAFVYSLFGREEIVFDSEAVEFVNTLLFWTRRKRIPFKDITGLSTSSNQEEQFTLSLNTIGKSRTLMTSHREENFGPLAEVFRQEIPTLRYEQDANSIEPTEELEPRKKQPTDSEWEFEPAFGDQTVFTNFGRLELSSILALLFINLFWNGIVATFLFVPFAELGEDGMEKAQFVCLYIFMIPFIIIGCLMLLALIAQLLEPFRKTMWEFSDREIIRTVFYFGIPLRKSYPLMLPVQMQMSNPDTAKSSLKSLEGKSTRVEKSKLVRRKKTLFKLKKNANDEQATSYGIDFYEKSRLVVTWEGLTKGDADWLTTVLEKEQSVYRVSK